MKKKGLLDVILTEISEAVTPLEPVSDTIKAIVSPEMVSEVMDAIMPKNRLSTLSLVSPLAISAALPLIFDNTQQRYKQAAKRDIHKVAGKITEQMNLGLAAASFANLVYANGIYSRSPKGWKVSSDFKDLHSKFTQRLENGLVSKLYERANGQYKDYIYALAGTDILNLNDHLNNVAQISGYAVQYDAAVEVAMELSQRISTKGGNLYFAGHSLGGGEASLCALVTHHPAFVFNPAGLSKETLAKYGFKYPCRKADSLISNFISSTDVLNIVQDDELTGTLLVPSVGKRYFVDVHSLTILDGHSMDNMEKALKELAKSK